MQFATLAEQERELEPKFVPQLFPGDAPVSTVRAEATFSLYELACEK